MSRSTPLNDQVVSQGDPALPYQLRGSSLHVLDASLRGTARVSTARSLHQVRDALRADALEEALRQLDRAWRCLPDDAAIWAPIYGRLLMLEGRDYNAALRLLQRALEFAPDPEVSALMALALLRLQRPEDARRQLQAALAEYCAESGGLLFQVAGEVMQHPAIGTVGWIGRGPNLEFVGELAAGETSSVLDIGVDGQVAFSQLLPGTAREGRRTFSFQIAQMSLTAKTDVSVRGVPLLGSGARPPRDFGLDGRTHVSGRRVSGWARLGWSPNRKLRLRVEDEHAHRAAARRARAAQWGGRWPFEIDLRAARIRGAQLRICARLPDGRWQPLPDSPLLLEPAVQPAARRAPRLPQWSASASRPRPARALNQHQRPTDVVIPVYRGLTETLACIDAVLASIDDSAQVIVVDDATDEPALAAALDALAAGGRITLLRNASNEGFAASVNRATALHATHDVVLLNSDTLVFDDWLTRLRAAAYSGAKVGTVTPLSNHGSIASYPRAQGTVIAPQEAAALHALAASTHSGTRLAIPVGVGFCLYLRRDCLREVGNLDAVVFAAGYGEETDFCLRARRHGWSHHLAADVFVYHAGALSFGARRAALLERGARLINLRHPGYDRFIQSFLARDPLQPLRRALDERRLCAIEGRFVLLVTLALSGGVNRFVDERCRALRSQGLIPLILRPAAAGEARRCELSTEALTLPNLRYEIPTDLSALKQLLGSLPLDAIEIQHFLHLDARVIEAVRSLPVPYDVMVHDYAWICPRVTLIDGSGRYCGEPAISTCQACVRRNGSHLGEAISVARLRARSATWLRAARQVIAPSSDAAGRLRRHFEALDVAVQPHAPPVAPPPRPPGAQTGAPVRVGLIGAIGEHKGYDVLLACARDARARRLPLEFVVIGYTHNDAPLLATGKVFITGRYSEGEASHLLRREQPDVAWFPSVAPETWCYTLDHALEAGLPVAAFDLGAIAERLRAADAGLLLPLKLPPGKINSQLLKLAGGTEPAVVAASARVNTSGARQRRHARVTARNSDAVAMPKTSNEPAQRAPAEAMSASVQVLPLPQGLYLFSVKSASPIPARVANQLSVPAVHVGLGPGVRSDQVEFVAGLSTEGAWLFAPGDLLVTKIKGSGATLILTSVRGAGGEILAITVERLDARATGVAEAATPKLSTAPAPSAPSAPSAPKVIRAAAHKPSSKTVASSAASASPLPVRIGAHIRKRGDMSFAEESWAGRVAPGLWIESFSVRPLQQFGPQDIEYKGLTGGGFETPWLSNDKMCGTKGMATPLVGFAIRFKPSPAAAGYDCEYSGYFQSGLTVGPLRNGAPCRSSVANDPLEGLQVRLVKRAALPAVAARDVALSAAVKPGERPITPASHPPSQPAFEPTPSRPPSVSESGPERLLLNVGCGPRGARNLPAYFNSWRERRIDIDASVEPDILADLTDLSPIETGSADAVWAAHCVEHLYAHEVRIALTEFRRVLREDGFVCMIVPDLQAVAQYVAADRLHETLYESPAGPVTPHDVLFGFGAAIERGHTSMAHRCGFTPGMLQRCFQGLPFGEVLLRRRSQALELVAVARATPAKSEAERAALMAALEL